MNLFEIYIAATEDTPARSLYRRAEGPAVSEAKKLKKEGAVLAVYECELAITTPVETYFAFLNGELAPVRGDLVYGRDIAPAAPTPEPEATEAA